MGPSPAQSVPESMYRALCVLLTHEGVVYRTLRRAPTFTSAAAAHMRGDDVRIGGKILVIKVGADFRL